MSVRIVCDSGSDIVEAHDHLTVLPLTIVFGDTEYRDGVDLTHERFYELLVESDELPKTGQVTPYAFSQAFDEAAAAGDEVVCITLSSRLSGTNQSAATAARQAGCHVRVVDSLNVCVGERVQVEYALRLARMGWDADAIADELERKREHVRVIALLDTLEYLRRGGRISAAAAGVGTVLSIKPVITVTDGVVDIMGKARGSKNGRNMLNRYVERHGGIDYDMPLSLGYAGMDDKLLRKYILDSAHLWEGKVEKLPISQVGGTIGTHVGPGAIALGYFSPED